MLNYNVLSKKPSVFRNFSGLELPEFETLNTQIKEKYSAYELSLGVPAQQALLAASVVFLAITSTTQYLAEKRKASNNRKIFSKFSSKKERIVFESLTELAKEKKYLKTSDIIESVQKRVGKPVSSKKVYSILNALQEYGFVKRIVISVGNSPVLVWKT